MAHPVTRLSGGTISDYQRPRGGKPELSVAEIAHAAGCITDRLQYWAVLAYQAGITPPTDEWPLLTEELQNLVLRSWKAISEPRRLDVKMIDQLAVGAWSDFVNTEQRWTQTRQAEACGMEREKFRTGYHKLHAVIVRSLEAEMWAGLKTVNVHLENG